LIWINQAQRSIIIVPYFLQSINNSGPAKWKSIGNNDKIPKISMKRFLSIIRITVSNTAFTGERNNIPLKQIRLI
jgi:hypothetical protein